jgi:hypothetical protein
MYETTAWPFVPARDFLSHSGPRAVRLIVIHDMEAVEGPQTAENVAKYFQNPDKPSSAHICVDNNSIVQCVHDSDVAYAAPGANKDGIQIELAGYGYQTRTEWLDSYGIALLALGSDAVAQYCLKFSVPPIKLTVGQVADGVTKGICGHVDVTNAFHQSDHQDPGPDFPWDYFINSVTNFYNVRKTK